MSVMESQRINNLKSTQTNPNYSYLDSHIKRSRLRSNSIQSNPSDLDKLHLVFLSQSNMDNSRDEVKLLTYSHA